MPNNQEVHANPKGDQLNDLAFQAIEGWNDWEYLQTQWRTLISVPAPAASTPSENADGAFAVGAILASAAAQAHLIDEGPVVCACGNPDCTMMAKTIRTPHGHYTRYTNHGCRCDLCVAAYRTFRLKYRVVKPEVCGCGNPTCTRRTRREVVHGLSCYFRHHCRCGICKIAMRIYQGNRRGRIRAVANLAALNQPSGAQGVQGYQGVTAKQDDEESPSFATFNPRYFGLGGEVLHDEGLDDYPW